MANPISFDQFKSNPIAAVAFAMLLAVGYLFMELRSTHQVQLEEYNERITKLEADNAEYKRALNEVNEKLIECFRLNRQQ